MAAGGALTQVVGFGIDGRLHAADPALASREDIFTLSNVGHLCVYLGLAAVFVGIIAAFLGPRLYRPTHPHQVGRRLAQLSAPVAAMALIGGFGVGANASSLGAVHNHDHGVTVAAGDTHVPGDHDHAAATDHGHDAGTADHDHTAGMDHGHDDSTASADDDHAHTVGMDHSHSDTGDTVATDHDHTAGMDHSHAASTSGDHDASTADHGNDHDHTGTTTGDHGNDHDHTGTTTGDHGNDHDHTDTTSPAGHDHEHTTDTTTPGSTDTTQPHDHDHGGTTTTTPGSTDTTQPHDHDHTGTTTPGDPTLPGANCKNGSHDHGHLPPVELDPATKLAQDAQLAVAKQYAEQYPTAAAAINAGYSQVTHYLCGIGAHYMKFSWVDETFNPAQPEILLYDGDGPFAKLVGVNYYVGSSSGVAPDGFAGPNDQWHQHIGLCLNIFFVIGPEDWTDEQCKAAGGVKQADGGYYWLLHAWVVTGYEMPTNWFNPSNPVLGPGPWDFPGGITL